MKKNLYVIFLTICMSSLIHANVERFEVETTFAEKAFGLLEHTVLGAGVGALYVVARLPKVIREYDRSGSVWASQVPYNEALIQDNKLWFVIWPILGALVGAASYSVM